MGDRGQVEIKMNGKRSVFLYTHNGASDLIETVAEALKRGMSRWTDNEYLARIIFSEMIRDDIEGDTGFGIGINKHDDAWRQVILYPDKQRILIEDHGKTRWSGTFERFIDDITQIVIAVNDEEG